MYQGALRLKFKKIHRMRLSYRYSKETRFFCPKFCDIAVQAITTGKLNNRHIETGRRYIRRRLKKGVFIKINMFPYHSFTKKPISARMGKGKGRVYGWLFPCARGRILYEIRLNKLMALRTRYYLNLLKGLSKKMPVRLKTIRLIY